MISAGEVGVQFSVSDEASATLQRIADRFNEIQAIVDRVTAAVDKIGSADGGLLKLQEALGLTAKAGEDAGVSITESFGRVDSAVKTAAEGVNALKASFLEAAEAAKAIQVASGNIGGGGSGGPHSPFGGGPGSGMGIPGAAMQAYMSNSGQLARHLAPSLCRSTIQAIRTRGAGAEDRNSAPTQTT